MNERSKHASLQNRVKHLVTRTIPLSGEIYRSTSPRYANSIDLLTGDGSRRFGGRWNPPGVRAVYGSFTPQTALEESLAHADYYSLPVNSTMPRTFVAIEFTLTAVLDLTDGRNRQVLGISEKRLLECDWRADMKRGTSPITHQVAGAVAHAGIEAVLTRSAADPAGRNLVIYMDNLRSGSSLDVVAPDRLSGT